MARNRSPLPRNTVAKKRSSCSPIRSRSTPMNHRKATPANGRRFSARGMDFPLLESHVPSSNGVAGAETRMSTRLMMSRIENTIPAIAAARGAFNRSRTAVTLFSSIISSVREASDVLCNQSSTRLWPSRDHIRPFRLQDLKLRRRQTRPLHHRPQTKEHRRRGAMKQDDQPGLQAAYTPTEFISLIDKSFFSHLAHL